MQPEERERLISDIVTSMKPVPEHIQERLCVDSLGAGDSNRKLEIDLQAWQDCRKCPDFENCRDFSSAKLEMQRVLREL